MRGTGAARGLTVVDLCLIDIFHIDTILPPSLPLVLCDKQQCGPSGQRIRSDIFDGEIYLTDSFVIGLVKPAATRRFISLRIMSVSQPA